MRMSHAPELEHVLCLHTIRARDDPKWLLALTSAEPTMNAIAQRLRALRRRILTEHGLRLPYQLTSVLLHDAYCIAAHPRAFLSPRYEASHDELECHRIALSFVTAYEQVRRSPTRDLASGFVSQTQAFLIAHAQWNERIRLQNVYSVKCTLTQMFALHTVLPVLTMGVRATRATRQDEPDELDILCATAIDTLRAQLRSLQKSKRSCSDPDHDSNTDFTQSAFSHDLLEDPFHSLNTQAALRPGI